MKTNRWLNGAIPAVGIHISIGAVYAWSVFTNPVMDALGASLSQVSWVFSIAIFFFGYVRGIFGNNRREYGAKEIGLFVRFVLLQRSDWQRLCHQPAISAFVVFILRLYRRDWFGYRLYHPCKNIGKLVL